MIVQVDIADLAIERGGQRLFSGLSAQVSSGKALALSGRNGTGKTSLLRAIAGLLRPATGTIGFGELDPAEARARDLHLLGHLDGLKASQTVAEELSFWSALLGGEGQGVARGLDRLGLSRLKDLEIRRLSAGQRRRVALARLIVVPRHLWLLDEPLSPLDADWRSRVGEIMGAHLGSGGLIIAAVHDRLPIAADVLEIAP